MHHWISQVSFGLPVHVVRANLDFFGIVRKYERLPSGNAQFCTDMLKTQPIGEFIHTYMNEHGFTKAINATGMRAEESKRRAKKLPFALSKGEGTSGMYMPKKHPTHVIHDWMPIFGYTTEEVFEEIRMAGQEPHELYSKGFSRLSCVFCVNGRVEEHQMASEMRPELAQKMANLEREIGRSVRLKQVKGEKLPRYMDEYLRGLAKNVA